MSTLKKSVKKYEMGYHFSMYLRHPLFSKKFLSIFFLGLASGIPLPLIGGTLQAWMSSEKIGLPLIGFFSLVGLPYSIKFLWAPLLDRYSFPWLGPRKGWIFFFQSLTILSMSLLAFSDPKNSPIMLACTALMLAFVSASQDLCIDAYRTEVLSVEEYGLGASIATLSYRFGYIFSSAVALLLVDLFSWKRTYLLMALGSCLGYLGTWFAPDVWQPAKTGKTFQSIFIQPLMDFLKRPQVSSLLLFVLSYKLDVIVTLGLMTAFLLDIGFTHTEIATVSKGFGLIASLLGSLVGGLLLQRWSIQRSLWIFGGLQSMGSLAFYFLAKVGNQYPMLVVAIGTENFFSGMGNAAYSAFLMQLCNPQFTATQFALLTSLMAFSRTFAVTPTGWLAQTLGWEWYFLIAMSLAIPGFILLTQYPKWTRKVESAT